MKLKRMFNVFVFCSSFLVCHADDFTVNPQANITIYQKGVPHTNRMGQYQEKFDSKTSFFPKCIYHALTGKHFDKTYQLLPIKQAGFNCVHTWEGQTLDQVMPDVEKNNLQIIYHHPKKQEIKKYANHKNILGWYLDEEPTSAYPMHQLAEKFENFQNEMKAIKTLDPIHPVFALDASWITFPMKDWWVKWNTAGDVSSHDNYVLGPGINTLSSKTGIPESVSLAVASNLEKKPLWFVVQAFEEPSLNNYRWSLPNIRELRAMVYTAIIHGATGIVYFSMDNWVTRNGNVLGIAPNPSVDYPTRNEKRLIVSKALTNLSQSLWQGVVGLNGEIDQLKPAIFSITSKMSYRVLVRGKPVTSNPVRCLLKDLGAELMLLCVNIDKTPLEVKFEFDTPLLSVEKMFEDSAVLLSKNSWISSFDEFGVNVYKIKRPLETLKPQP